LEPQIFNPGGASPYGTVILSETWQGLFFTQDHANYLIVYKYRVLQKIAQNLYQLIKYSLINSQNGCMSWATSSCMRKILLQTVAKWRCI